jgi:hypothetical protein
MTPERLRNEPLRSRAIGMFLEEACKRVAKWKNRNLIAKPQKSLQLYVPVPAHFDAHSSVYGGSSLSLGL